MAAVRCKGSRCRGWAGGKRLGGGQPEGKEAPVAGMHMEGERWPLVEEGARGLNRSRGVRAGCKSGSGCGGAGSAWGSRAS